MTVLVTGGTGFVGAHVVRALLARGGDAVRCLARPGGDRSNLDGCDVEIVEGDLRDPASLRAACAGCREVYHCAADYRLFVRRPRDIHASNVDGARHLLAAAAEAGAERIVHTSSVGALGLEPGGRPATETTPVGIEAMVGHYKRSKYLAERVAVEAAAAGAPVVIVNPSTPVGELDVKPTPTGRIIVDFLSRRMPAYVDTGLNLIDVARRLWRPVGRGWPAANPASRSTARAWRATGCSSMPARRSGNSAWSRVRSGRRSNARCGGSRRTAT